MLEASRIDRPNFTGAWPGVLVGERRPGVMGGRGCGRGWLGVVVRLWCVLVVGFLVMFSCGVADGAVVHSYLPSLSKGISVAAESCGEVSGSLGQVNASIVDEGDLWLAEQQEPNGVGERVDEFDANTGRCTEQLEHAVSLERTFQGIAVGHKPGGREVYVGAAERLGGGEASARVGVFGPAGGLQAVWSGADTLNGSFAESGGGAKANVTDVAVDESGVAGDWASGDVLVSTASNIGGVVDVFKPVAGGVEPPGEDVQQLTGICPVAGESCPGAVIPFEEPDGVAVDQANGEVFVVDKHKVVDIFRLKGLAGEYEYVGRLAGFERQVFGVVVDGDAVDGGDIYVWEGGQNQKETSVVDEFSAVGERPLLGRLTGTPAGVFEDVSSVSVDPVSHDVFVGDFHKEAGFGVMDVFGPDVVIPDVVSEEASGVTAGGAVFHGKVSTLGEGVATCRFVWGTSRAFGHVAACEPESVEGENVAVKATVSGLAPGQTYYFRLEATSEKNGQTNTGFESQDQSFVTSGTEVLGESVSLVTSRSAVLKAVLNPDGFRSSVYFQYGLTSSYGSVEPAPPGQQLALLVGENPISQGIDGLAPDTVYHYRVVAVSDVNGETVDSYGRDETFRTQVSGESSLPDGRHWEMVSPPEKQGARFEPIDSGASTNGTVIQAAADGDAITYIADAPTEPVTQGNSNDVQIFSARTQEGWSTHDLTVPHVGATDGSVGPGNEYRFFSEDLSSAIVQPFGGYIAATEREESEPFSPTNRALSALEASEQTAFQHTNYLNGHPDQACTGGCYRPLVTGKPGYANVPANTTFGELGGLEGQAERPCPPDFFCGPQFVDATSDDSHVIFTSSVALTSAALAGTRNLYEWDSGVPSGQQLQLVSVLPEGEGGGAAPEATLGEDNGGTRNAVSDDGSRVFFSTGGKLYMRDVALEQTVRLDAGGKHGSAGGLFEFASSDGSLVLFMDTQRLTSDSGAGSFRPDLYECVIVEVAGKVKCELSDLTPASSVGESTAVQGGVLGASEDGSWVYFVADGVLENDGVPVAGAVHGTCELQITVSTPGTVCNLYVRHEGVTRLVAVLSGADAPDWAGGGGGESLNRLTARVSPDGEWLAFMSNYSLTGYDNEDVTSKAPGERLDEETYLYDAATGRVICVSCDPSGAQPAGEEYGDKLQVVGGNGVWPDSAWLAADLPGWTPYRLGKARYQSRYLSDNGRLFFNGHDGLVPGDVNGTWDVYEWEPVGVGGCSSSVSSGGVVFVKEGEGQGGGCVGLISSGESPDESAFMDASATGGRDSEGHEGGGDVFFLTSAKLAPQDRDDSYDVYDAHECTGGSPCPSPAAEHPPECVTTDSCRIASAPEPEVFGAPASATFSGPGNASVPPPVKAVVLTRAQKLKNALKACHAKHNKHKRQACETAAKKRYGPAKKPHASRAHGK